MLTPEQIEMYCNKAEAYRQCNNAIGKYIQLLYTVQFKEMIHLFALDTPGAWVEMVWGRYDERKGIETLYLDLHEKMNDVPGMMSIHTICTPVIEIADDCKTAKAVFLSPGVETYANGNLTNEESHCDWCWIKYDCEFANENGVWKIWHLRTVGIFQCDYRYNWIEAAEKGLHDNPNCDYHADWLEPGWEPDGPIVRIDERYRPDKVMPNDPPMPYPYATYDGYERFGIKVNRPDGTIIKRDWNETYRNDGTRKP